MMPVPLGAGAIMTLAAPWWPKTLWWIVPFFNETPILVTDADGIKQVISDGNATAADICKGDVAAACDKAGIK